MNNLSELEQSSLKMLRVATDLLGEEIVALRNEVARLRLTDDEVEMLLWLAKVGGDTHPALKTVTPEMRPILQGIVKRLGGVK